MELSIKTSGSFGRIMSAGKTSHLPNAGSEKNPRNKGESCCGQPLSREGWSICNRTHGKGSGEGMGWMPAPSIAVTGKKGLEATKKL